MTRFATILMIVFATTPAVAADNQFGSAGVIAPSGAVSLTYQKESPPEGDSVSTTSLSFAPTLMYFVIDNLAVGGGLVLDRTSGDDESFTTYGIAPAIGYNIRFDSLSLMPTATLQFAKGTLEYDFMGTTEEVNMTVVNLLIDAPILYHAGNFFVGVGPRFSTTLVSKSGDGDAMEDASKSTTLGVVSQIGGWF